MGARTVTRFFAFWLTLFAMVAVMVTLALVAASRSEAGQESLVSWFGPGLYGNGMACGGTLEPWTNGVASRTLPCGTRLTVCYRHRCSATRVVDRGPFVAGRDLDLAAGLATRLHFSGVHSVRWHLRR